MIEGKDYWIVNKSESRFMRFLSRLLFFNKAFMTGYVTTIGRTIYCPDGQISDATRLHELQHVADYRKYGPWFVLSYLLLLPLGITMRAFWERRAYAITIREVMKSNEDYARSPEFKEHLVRCFTGPDYLYMDLRRKSVERWIDSVLNERG